jgi:transposase InsO family protein
MGIRDKPIAPASPWQNGFAERLIGSIRRECLDHYRGFRRGSSTPNLAILRALLPTTSERIRSLDKDAPISRTVQRTAGITSFPILRGLHHRYARV